MKSSYSLWQQGRGADGRIASMTLHACPSESIVLGYASLGVHALTAVAQFGVWYELRQANELAAAQFEERRNQWLDEALAQWITEHRDSAGVRLDSTRALGIEASKLVERLLAHDDMDVPQVLLLKVERVANYLDDLTAVWRTLHRELVSASNSDPTWVHDAPTSAVLVEQALDGARDDAQSLPGATRAAAALGFAAWFVPAVGPLFGGSILGGAVVREIDKQRAEKRANRLAEFPQLLRLSVAAQQAAEGLLRFESFLERQGLPEGIHLFAVDAGPHRAQLLLGPGQATPWYRRMFRRAERPLLRTLPAIGMKQPTRAVIQ